MRLYTDNHKLYLINGNPLSALDLSVDKSGLISAYEQWPECFLEASNNSLKIDHMPEFYKSVVLCGMGGSATSCDIVNDIMLNYSSTRSMVLRGGRMPKFVDKYTLVLINSSSGNTEESITMMNDASQLGAEVLCFSSGGKLKEQASKLGQKHMNINNLGLPRASLPYLLMPNLNSVSPLINTHFDISSIYDVLSDVKRQIAWFAEDNIARQIASFSDATICCFSSPILRSASTRFKNSLNENAKVHCIEECVLEASHNEIVPFTFENNISLRTLLLSWENDDVMVKSRFNRIESLFEKIGTPVLRLNIENPNMLEAILSSTYILDFATLYLAMRRRLDPSPTPAIDILKDTRN